MSRLPAIRLGTLAAEESLHASGYGTLAALVIFLVASVWLGTLAQRAIRGGSFLQGYFLGNRGLGTWALALTATVQSGGTFMGYPSLVYSYGWVVALWIGGYMVVPITGFGVLAKRVAQLSRRTGAITVPDLIRERFNSPAAGLISSLLILFVMSFMMVGQFKAGAEIMKVVWPSKAAAYLTSMLAGEAPLPPREGQGEGESVQSAQQRADVNADSKTKSVPTATAKPPESKYDRLFLFGLAVFAITVVGYTMIGGFLAAVWTDLFQSVLMWIGVMLLLGLTLWKVGGLEEATLGAVAAIDAKHPGEGAAFAFAPGYSVAKDGAKARDFLPPGLAISFFFVWVFSGVASPAGVVRLMACKDTPTIRRSIFALAAYNMMIYIPLLIICVAARGVMDDLAHSDEVMPRMALWTTSELWGGPLVAGLVLVAPFGAVMATVSSYLVVIASGLVHDVYQRFLRPNASSAEIRLLTYGAMALIGVIAVAANIRPVNYLQVIVVFCGSTAASSFVVPMLMTAFWRRATAKGVIASMLTGFGTSVVLFTLGGLGSKIAPYLPDSMEAMSNWLAEISADPGIGPASSFRSLYVFGMEPIVWGLALSLVVGVVVTLCTKPPHDELISKLFDERNNGVRPA
jgi:SSS family solute:Na+ symporter/sodium/pantothenate symporter